MPPAILMGDKDMKRGDFDYRLNAEGSTVFKWTDSKSVFLASNYHGAEVTKVKRVVKKDGTKSDVSCPQIVKDYNNGMGGVDLAERYRALYCGNRKSSKWWHRPFFGILDIAFVNSYLVNCQLFGKVSDLQYRRNVDLGLLTSSPNKGQKRKNASKSP